MNADLRTKPKNSIDLACVAGVWLARPVMMAVLWSLTFSVYGSDELDIDAQVVVCKSCHGLDGTPTGSDIPIIAGQEFYYLYVQLKDYKAGRRENPIMGGMVQSMDKKTMQAISQHFADMQWPRVLSETESAKVESGESASVAGQCSQCHSTYQGDSRIPRLAGQQLPYLAQTMKDFKHKVRLNSPAKGSLMDSYSDEEIDDIAHFLADF